MADINWLNYFNAMGVDLNKDDPIETEFRLSFLDAIISIIFPEEPRIQGNEEKMKISFPYTERNNLFSFEIYFF